MSVTIDYLLRSSTKWKALTPAQRGLLVELWMWIDEQGTDGHIPDFMVKEFGIKKADLEALSTPATPGKAAWLDRNGTGWIAHDWLEHNPPSEPVLSVTHGSLDVGKASFAPPKNAPKT